MIKKLFLALAICLGFAVPAQADNRINWYYAQNPPVDWLNFLSVYHREADGQKTLDFMGQNTAMKYTNMTLSPTGSSFMGSVSAGANAYGSIYEYTVVDSVQVPPISTGVGSIFIPPNASQIMNQATLLAPVTQGPFTPPGTAGQSIIYLVEGQISTADQVSLSEQFYTITGTGFNQTVNRERDDSPIFQLKASAASTSPSIPTTDSGWVCIASIRVPQGTPANLSGATITPCPAWQGFADSSDVAHLTGVQATGSINITGTSTASQFISTVSTGSPPLIVTSTTPVANLSIGGNAATASAVTGIVPVVNGGTGTATPAIIAGNGITTTGSFPAQTLALASSPSIAGLTLSGLNANQCVDTNGSKALTSTGLDCLSGLTAGLNIAVGSGSAPSVATIATPSFTAITDTGLNASVCTRTNGSKVLTSATADCIVGINAGTNIVVGGTFTSPTVSTSTTPVFSAITDSGITAGQCVAASTGGLFVGTTCPSGTPVNSVLGTSPIAVALSGGVATVSISATPTFTGVNVSGLTASSSVCTDSSKNLTTAGCSGGGGAVSSVSAGSSGNLVISPTTGAVVADLASNINFSASGTATSLANFPSNFITLNDSIWNGSSAVANSAKLLMTGGTSASQSNLIWGGDSFSIGDSVYTPPGSGSTNALKITVFGTNPVLETFNSSGFAFGQNGSSYGMQTASTGATTTVGDIGDSEYFQYTASGITASGPISASNTITNSAATPLAFSNTGAVTITSAATGANTAFKLNASGSAPTSDLVDFQLGGTTKSSVLNGGGFSTTAATGLVLAGTTSNTITSAATGATDGYIFNNTGAASTALAIFQNNGATKFTISPTGLGTFTAGIVVGGPLTTVTSISMSGNITTSSNATNAVTLSGASAGVAATANAATTMLLGSDTTGAHDAFAANASNATPPTGNLFDFQVGGATKAFVSPGGGYFGIGSATQTVLSSIPPLYSQTGTQLANAHSAFTACTFTTGATSCSATLTGTGNTFTSASTYACSVSGNANGSTTTGTLTGMFNVISSGTVVVLGETGLAVSTGSYSLQAVCTGT